MTFEKAKAKTIGLLLAYPGIKKCAPMTEKDDDGTLLESLWIETTDGITFRIDYPVISYSSSPGGKAKLNMAIAGRLIYHHVKSAIDFSDIGYLSAQQALAIHALMPDENGTPRPLHEYFPGVDGKRAARSKALGYLAHELKQIEEKP